MKHTKEIESRGSESASQQACKHIANAIATARSFSALNECRIKIDEMEPGSDDAEVLNSIADEREQQIIAYYLGGGM